MWALGIIIFSLLSGNHPFNATNREKLFEAILSIDYEFAPAQKWEKISYDCKDLIENLLEPNTEKRLTPQQALNHPWFTSEGITGMYNQIKPTIIRQL